jgi:cell division protein FtsW
MVIVMATCALLVASGMPLRFLLVLGGGVLVLVLLAALVKPYVATRLTSFLHPWAHAAGSGFQAVQGQIALGSGGLFGRGPGGSVQKIFYLPEAHTDFILAIIGEELGGLGICALMCLYGLIAYAGLRAARGARNLYAALIAVGVTSLILAGAVLNSFAVLGLAPLTGVPLPFISYGASNLLVMLAGMGLLLNVAAGGSLGLRAVPDRPRASARQDSRDAGGGETARLGGARAATTDRNRSRRNRRTRSPGAHRRGRAT